MVEEQKSRRDDRQSHFLPLRVPQSAQLYLRAMRNFNTTLTEPVERQEACAHRRIAPIEEIRPGDVVWIAPGEKHWHGATPITAMTHIAIQEQLNGKVVEWMEKVSDEQYQAS